MENLYLYIYGNTILAFVFIYVNKSAHKRGTLLQNARELNISALEDRKVKQSQGNGIKNA